MRNALYPVATKDSWGEWHVDFDLASKDPNEIDDSFLEFMKYTNYQENPKPNKTNNTNYEEELKNF